MAELLVQAKAHWMDSLKQDVIDKMSKEEKASYDARSQIGDIIVVRPDGWNWGKEECLPNFIVVKMPDLKVEDAKKYEDSVFDITDPKNPIMLKRRQYNVPVSVVDTAKSLSTTAVNVTKSQTTTFVASITDKTSLIEATK